VPKLKRNNTKDGVQNLVAGAARPIMMRMPLKTAAHLTAQAKRANMPVGVFGALVMTAYLEKVYGKKLPRSFMAKRRGADDYTPPKSLMI